VTPGSEQQTNLAVVEQERRRLGQRLEEVSRLCESDVPPSVFYAEMLKRLLESLAAAAGAVWLRTPQGNLQIQFQVNLKEIGLDQSDEVRQSHGELLRVAVGQGKPMHLPPRSGMGAGEDGKAVAGNTTDFLLMIVPILLNDQVVGLIEIWQHPNRPPAAIPGFLQYMALMAELGGRYQRAQMLRQMTGQEQLWTQLEVFARQIHGSLIPLEVSYVVANEARRLIESDRVSVGLRYGSRVSVEAVSGADVVEKRSNSVRLMRRLCDRVLAWGEKLIFNGVRDDSLPPKVLQALDLYLAESPSKLLVVMPLRDERESKSKQPPRAVLVMECFEPPAEPQQILARLDVVAKHATSALYNAVQHRRIPFRWVWMPLAKAQEGVGGPTSAIVMACCVAATVIVSMLCLVPYPLKVDANGKLLPTTRCYIYSPLAGQVRAFQVKPGETFSEGRNLVDLYDFNDLGPKLLTLDQEILNAQTQINSLQGAEKKNLTQKELADQTRELEAARATLRGKKEARDMMMKSVEADRRPDRAGYFFLKAPAFTNEQAMRLGSRKEWTVLNSNFEEMKGSTVKSQDKLLWLGAKEGPWEVEIKIPQKNIGKVFEAFNGDYKKELNVDFLLRSDPSRVYKGKLRLDRIGGEALSNKEDKDEAEPTVLAFVRIDNDDADADLSKIDAAYLLPHDMAPPGTEVHGKIYCDDHPMGFSLFYGVFEFLYEKVVFFF
jgi:hypothetical protein